MSYFQDSSYGQPPTEESLVAKVLRESDERFHATFPDARAAAEQEPLYSSQPYQTSTHSSGATFTQTNSPSLPTVASSSLEDALHHTYLTPNEVSGISAQSGATSQSRLSTYSDSDVQQCLVQQLQAIQITSDEVPALAWATQPTILQGGLTLSPLSFTSLYTQSIASSASYPDANTALAAPASNYHDLGYQQSLSMGQSSAELYQREAPMHAPQPLFRHALSRYRRSQSYPYSNPETYAKSKEINHGLPAPITSPALLAHVPGHVGHPRRSSYSHSRGSSLTRSTPPQRLTYSPIRASPSRSTPPQQSAWLSSHSSAPLSLPPSKRQLEKKPLLACLFCRGRKIACSAPELGSIYKTCNQCQKRSLACEYPAESQRVMRKKKNTVESAEAENEKSTCRPASSSNFPG